MDTKSVDCYAKAQAPVNIAIIKYWGKLDEKLKIPINDSLSGTLSMTEMCTTTSVYLSKDFEIDQLILNGEEQNLSSEKSPAKRMIEDMRNLTKFPYDERFKVKIVTENNFPTAAGLASSAAGYACLAYALGQVYGLTDPCQLSKIARKGSGSACRSLFGGFVQWIKGEDHDSSMACQVVDHLHWPSMRVLVCVVNDGRKDVSSSSGMSESVKTSDLIKYRAENIVPKRIDDIKRAIMQRDFQTFARITMQDSNQFHAICLDTFPPIMYLNGTSKQIIQICSTINEFYGCNKVAYTFDAGPNACIYLLEEYLSEFITILNSFFSCGHNQTLEIKGIPHDEQGPLDMTTYNKLFQAINQRVKGVEKGIKYLINTSIGEGPKLLQFERK